jgi:hypothetical protein
MIIATTKKASTLEKRSNPAAVGLKRLYSGMTRAEARPRKHENEDNAESNQILASSRNQSLACRSGFIASIDLHFSILALFDELIESCRDERKGEALPAHWSWLLRHFRWALNFLWEFEHSNVRNHA